MPHITKLSDSELMVAHYEGETEDAIQFIDSWNDAEMVVVDMGRIILPFSACARFETDAKTAGLEVGS